MWQQRSYGSIPTMAISWTTKSRRLRRKIPKEGHSYSAFYGRQWLTSPRSCQRRRKPGAAYHAFRLEDPGDECWWHDMIYRGPAGSALVNGYFRDDYDLVECEEAATMLCLPATTATAIEDHSLPRGCQ